MRVNQFSNIMNLAASLDRQDCFRNQVAGTCPHDPTTNKLIRLELVEPAPLPPVDLPELPDFLTGHIDPLTGLDNSNDGDGSSERPALFGALAGSSRAAVGPGGAVSENPYAGMDISRNAPCPCGSGNKYKHCHGAISGGVTA